MLTRHVNSPEFWKRKLAAYLHDPPSKALEIRTHGERSATAFRQAGFSDTEIGDYFVHADHTAAAVDRLPFPNASAGVQCKFDGIRNGFLHPLSGDKLQFHAEFKSVEQGFEAESSIQPILSSKSLARLPNDAARWRAKFFAHWRLWPKHAIERDYRLGFLPADTRIPDHTIWAHMQVVSALAGCVGESKVFQPAFLKLQLGPVQDFIAAARSIRDLWSGSYILSWLMASGLKALSAEVGPDAVIFPNLRGQPLFDLHWREELWSQVSINDQESIWDSLIWQKNRDADLLIPNLPNVVLALVPADRAAELGRMIKDAIQAEWHEIADAVWNKCEEARLTDDENGITTAERRERFKSQVLRFLSVTWSVTPWPDNLEDALKLAESFDAEMPIQKARQSVRGIVEMATAKMPPDEREGRYYVGGKDGPKNKLNNLGLGWSVILAFNHWQLDAVRRTRAFSAAHCGGWEVGTFSNKDALTGRDEAVAGGKIWCDKAKMISQGPWASLFKHDDWLSAPTLIKRVWHFAYLGNEPWNLKTGSGDFRIPDTRSIARHDPSACDDDKDNESALENDPSEKYFAVISLDGDEIGKWVSGEKTPKFATQLADYKDCSGNPGLGSKSYFLRKGLNAFLEQHRPLSPSYHLQFSEALSNFALLFAGPIVEAFDGRLIYAGGDDVIALVPADAALGCAEALRTAFQGRLVEHPTKGILFSSPAPGYLNSTKARGASPIPVLVPGPAADSSVGIAIAHFKTPLQDVVREARLAEKRAKKSLDRSAVAVTLVKRSGETIKWGCKWASGGLHFYQALAHELDSETLSRKFPYRLAELLSPYLTETTPLISALRINSANQTAQPIPKFNASEVILQEFNHTLTRQRGTQFPTDRSKQELLMTYLINSLNSYLSNLQHETSEVQIGAVIGVCQTVAFSHRTRSENVA